jgi:Transposase IS4
MPYASLQPLNGNIPYREWGFRLPTGDTWRYGSNSDTTITRLEVFLQLFPPLALNIMLTTTNDNVKGNNVDLPSTKQELLKFIGTIFLTTKYEWNKRVDMSRDRFNDRWNYMQFSNQPATKPDHVSSEKYRWMLVNDFVEAFNGHQAYYFVVSDRLCIDESFSRWYGQGGAWINMGLLLFRLKESLMMAVKYGHVVVGEQV